MKVLRALLILPIATKGFNKFCILVVMMNPRNIIYPLAGSNYPILDHVTIISECSTLIQSSIGYPTNSSFFSHGNQSSENSRRCFDTNVTNLRRFVVMPSCQVDIPYMVIEYCVNVIIRVLAEN